VLRHRIFTNFNADAEGVDVEQVIQKILDTVPEPTYGEPMAARPRKAAERPAAPPPAASAAGSLLGGGSEAIPMSIPGYPQPPAAAPPARSEKRRR
jgi:hypothetical protein